MPSKNELPKLVEKIQGMLAEASKLEENKIRVGWFGNTVTSKKRTPPTPMDRLSERARLLNNGREKGTTVGGKSYPAIPPRPFMDVYRAKHHANVQKALEKVPSYLLNGVKAEKIQARIGGLGVRGLVLAMNEKTAYVPNAASTVAAYAARHAAQIKRNRKRKGTPAGTPIDKQPLRDTGELIQSVHWDIAPNKK